MAQSERAAARQLCTCWPTARFVLLLPLAASGAGQQQKDTTPLVAVTNLKTLHLSASVAKDMSKMSDYYTGVATRLFTYYDFHLPSTSI